MSEASITNNKPVGTSAKVGLSLVLVLLIGGGVYLLQRGAMSVEEAISSRSWPTVTGEIIRSSVKTIETPIKKNGRVVPNEKSCSYAPSIEYRYTVNGKEFTGTRVTVEDESVGTRASAQAIVNRFLARKTVAVSYRPDRPAIAVLQPGSWAGSYRWFLPGGLLVFVPLLLLWGFWSKNPEPAPSEVQCDENHILGPRLLAGMVMFEEIVRWEPGQAVHIRRQRVGFVTSIFSGVIMGLVFGIPLGLLPAIFFLSGRGVIFMAQFFIAVSAVLAVASAIGLMLWGRRREYLLDWTLGSIHWEIGWSRQEAPIESIERLTLSLPDPTSARNPVVDSHALQVTIQGKSYTLLETNGKGLVWSQTRDRLVRLARELSEALNVPWSEVHERAMK